MAKTLQPTPYAQHKYNITQPIDLEIAINYGRALMSIAGADGELKEEEFQWYVQEQEIFLINSEEYLEEIRRFDWKNANLQEILTKIKDELPMNFRRTMLYQAIKMCRADENYHQKEKASVAKAAKILDIEDHVLISIESLAIFEEINELNDEESPQKTSDKVEIDNDESKMIENLQKIEWNHLSLELLKEFQSSICKAIDHKKEELKLIEFTDKKPEDYSYKASLAKVSPDRLRKSLSDYQSCVFLISLGSKNFVNDKRLEGSIKWISENFKTCLVLVTDSIYRLTIQIRSKLKEDENRSEALDTGLEYIKEKSPLFEKYNESCRFEFKLTSEIEKESDFETYYGDFKNLYQNNESFGKMVDSFAQIYLNRGEEAKSEEMQEFMQKYKDLATTYLLEESAFFTCLAKAGWPAFVYPGSIKTFEEIAEGLHPDVPLPLQHMIWVSLRLKKKVIKN